MEPKELALELVKILDSKKGEDIRMLHTTELTSLSDYLVICTANSTTQIKTLSEACEEEMRARGEAPKNVEGRRGNTWVLLDFYSVIVHVLTEETRAFYDLERLWGDAKQVDLSDILTKN